MTVNVDRLADVTLALVQQRSALAEVLDVAPAALGNLARAYNPDYGTLDTRDNGLGSANAEVVVCGALDQARAADPPIRLDPLVPRTCRLPPPRRDLRPASPATPTTTGSPTT